MQDLLQTISRIIHQINVSMYIILRIIMRFNDDREMVVNKRQVTIFRSELFTIAHRSQFINEMILPNHSHDSPIPRSIIVQDPRKKSQKIFEWNFGLMDIDCSSIINLCLDHVTFLPFEIEMQIRHTDMEERIYKG